MTSVPDLPDRLAAALQDRYALERELGRGGMATVYLARDRRHARLVALNVLHPELAHALGPGRFPGRLQVRGTGAIVSRRTAPASPF